MFVEPTWKRIGLLEPLGEYSGQGIGIIILDDIVPHLSLRHLQGRVKCVEVHKDFSITCADVFDNPLTEKVTRYSSHGIHVLQLLTHKPFKMNDHLYSGLAQAANFIFLPETQPDRLKIGLEWILKQNWNIKILLNLFTPHEKGWMEPTTQEPDLQALQPALDAGLLVVAAGGNSRALNNLHPKEYFVVGGYNDKGSNNSNGYEPHPSVAYGMNGDGYYRPDVITPYTYLPVPSLIGEDLDYFGGTCGCSTLVAGLCASFMSTNPALTPNDIRNVLIETGESLDGFPAPIVNGEKARQALRNGYRNSKSPSAKPLVKITNEHQSFSSENPLERALSLTRMIKNKGFSREEIWKYANDKSHMVKKVAIRGLDNPIDLMEREKYWNKVHQESSEFGVKEAWVYALFNTTNKEELNSWMSLVKYQTIDIWICINLFLQRYYPDAPEMDISPDPAPKVMDAAIAPVLDWYLFYQNGKT